MLERKIIEWIIIKNNWYQKKWIKKYNKWKLYFLDEYNIIYTEHPNLKYYYNNSLINNLIFKSIIFDKIPIECINHINIYLSLNIINKN